jgi:hypothetical protein
VTPALVRTVIDEELRDPGFRGGRYDDAATLFRDLVLAPECAEFLTIPAYNLLD